MKSTKLSKLIVLENKLDWQFKTYEEVEELDYNLYVRLKEKELDGYKVVENSVGKKKLSDYSIEELEKVIEAKRQENEKLTGNN
jgi:hypothetical protein